MDREYHNRVNKYKRRIQDLLDNYGVLSLDVILDHFKENPDEGDQYGVLMADAKIIIEHMRAKHIEKNGQE